MNRKKRLQGDEARAVQAQLQIQPVRVQAQLVEPAPASPRHRTPPEPILIPQVIVTLSSAGTLQAELPGANGSRRVIPLGAGSTSRRDERIEAVLIRILTAQSRNQIELGLDGAPTSRQLLHWERHWQFPDDRCPHCLAEGAAHRPSRRWARASEHAAGDGSVTVRRLVPKGRAARMKQTIQASLEEIGL